MKMIEGKAFVRRVYKLKGEVVEDQTKDMPLEVHVFEGETAKVEVVLTGVENLGNYESYHVTVGVTLPCYPEEKDACLAHALEWTKDALLEEIPKMSRRVK